ncbi:T9SS type A sorting domain-containing protein [Yeosuana sp. MJ-SS3]|uniref:T9SS type A sorting domain-containing protein n=1 Tax=Gilvirhabdus luticola TaxID=3079858 RepID=A0ABU3U438_9FLAO|nr:kelch repeat-containing protein [Yeosuana sp. MJ-SS3]MDU8885116.1 T9SS type A sorting domain-containing protein [Yeosuana sp. MJ-SS3]
MKRSLILFIAVFFFSFYTISSQTWTEKSEDETYTARHEFGFVQAGDKFILFGGRESSQTLDVYDYTTNTWSNGGMAPIEFNHFQAITYEGLVWVIGAFKDNDFPIEEPVDHIYMYNPASEQWIQGMEIPASRKRGSAGLVIYNNKFYLVGGNTMGHDGGYVSYLDEFDPATGIWTQLTNAPRARDHFHAVTFNNKLYAIGGRLTGGTGGVFEPLVPEVDVYDFTTEMWSTLDASKNIPTTRAGLAVVVFDDEIYAIGGEAPGFLRDQVEAYDPVLNSWSTKNSLNYPRHGIQAIVSGDGIHVTCGNLSGSPIKEYEYYGTDNPQGSPNVNSTFEADETTKSFTYTELEGSVPVQINVSNSLGTTGTYIDTMELTGSADYTLDESYDNRLVGVNGNLIVEVTLNDTTKPTNNATLVITYNNSSTINVSLEGSLDTGLSTETQSLNRIKLYPNPVKDLFSVNKDISGLAIYDITGKLITKFNGHYNKNHLFDVSRFPKGLYFTKIEDENGMILTSKLVKL